MSRTNAAVGSKALAMSIPLRALTRNLERDVGPTMLASLPTDDEGVTFGYFEPGYSDLVQYGPTFACNGYAFADFQGTTNGDDQSAQWRILAMPKVPRPGRGVG